MFPSNHAIHACDIYVGGHNPYCEGLGIGTTTQVPTQHGYPIFIQKVWGLVELANVLLLLSTWNPWGLVPKCR